MIVEELYDAAAYFGRLLDDGVGVDPIVVNLDSRLEPNTREITRENYTFISQAVQKAVQTPRRRSRN